MTTAWRLRHAFNYGITDGRERVLYADFNLDHKLDIAVANENGQTVGILLGDGMGAFGAPVDLPAGHLPAFLATGDFNGDGLPDIVVVNETEDQVSVLLNKSQ